MAFRSVVPLCVLPAFYAFLCCIVIYAGSVFAVRDSGIIRAAPPSQAAVSQVSSQQAPPDKPSVAVSARCSGGARFSRNRGPISLCGMGSPPPGPVDLVAYGFEDARWDVNGCFKCAKGGHDYTLVIGGPEAYVCLEPRYD